MFFSLFFYVFNGRPHTKSISETTQLKIAKISGLVELCRGLVNPAFIWRSLKGHGHRNQLKWEDWHLSWTNFISCAAVPKLITISEVNDSRSSLNVATLCTTLMRFSAVTPEKRLLIFVLLWKKFQKWAYLADYLRICLMNFDQLFTFDRHMGGDNYCDVRFEIA